MNVSRNFLVVGPLFLIVGLSFGIHMSASGDHTMAPLHAHINLLGFALMMIFGLAYQALPAAGTSTLARVHFWLHLLGGLILTSMLFLLFSGRIAETAMVPLAPIAELAIMAGALIFAWNMFKHAR